MKTEKNFIRHEGFYPEAEIDKLLKGKGLKPNRAIKRRLFEMK